MHGLLSVTVAHFWRSRGAAPVATTSWARAPTWCANGSWGSSGYCPDTGHGLFLHDYRNVPVCEVCITDEELKRVSHDVTCKGCGRRLSLLRRRISRRASLNGDQRQMRAECSDACFRRVLHKRHRLKDHICTVCREEFTSARNDAKFCSSACRQWAYRLRVAAP